MVALRQQFAARYRQLKRQLGYLVELERLLDPPELEGRPCPSGRQVRRRVKAYMAQLEPQAQAHPEDAPAVARICATWRERWPRLFKCYAWPERYRTNNDLETFFGRLRTRPRQIDGRKATSEFINRYGEWAIFSAPRETYEEVLQRVEQFDQAQFDQEQERFLQRQQKLQLLYRFRHHPDRCLKEPEQQWAEAVASVLQ